MKFGVVIEYDAEIEKFRYGKASNRRLP